MLLSHLYFRLLHIDKASGKKRNICGFNKFCEYIYGYIHIWFTVTSVECAICICFKGVQWTMVLGITNNDCVRI